MARVLIKNVGDVTRVLEKRIILAMKASQDEIYYVINKHVKEYYDEPVFANGNQPKLYERTWHFLNSVIKTDVQRIGNVFQCAVEVDPKYLSRKYKGGATGLDVWMWADDMLHGGTVAGELKVWQDAIDELGDIKGIMNIIKRNLVKYGVPVR